MKSKLKSISEKNDISYYLNSDNIKNQKLVNETIEYFTSGEGSRVFKAIDLLNLLEKQYWFIVENIGNSEFVFNALLNLPLSELQRHILFGILIKWFGGYPVNNSKEDFQKTLKLIESEFLAYPEDTPEKDFCKVNAKQERLLRRFETAYNGSLNTGISATELFQKLGEKEIKRKINSFEDLYQSVFNKGYLSRSLNEHEFLIDRTKHQFNFNVWLQENRNCEYGNEEQYFQFLTEDVFLEYLRFEEVELSRFKVLATTSEDAYKVYQENFNILRNKFRIKRKATKEDCDQFDRLKIGDIISFNPEYKTTLEAYTLLVEYYAKAYFEYEKVRFLETYKVWNVETVKAEISEIEKFIADAGKVSLTDACKSYNTVDGSNNFDVYRRFTGGFYQHLEVNRYPIISAFGNIEAVVYGRYFIFYNYLKELFAEFQAKESHEDPYSISFSTDNSMTFRGDRIILPFNAYELGIRITKLREKMLNKDVCATDLQEFPQLIFRETGLKNHTEFAAWIYNIIETWVQQIEYKIHNGEKKRLFDGFLKLCEQYANETKSDFDQNKIVVPIIERKPFFKEDSIGEIFEILSQYFPNQKDDLLQLLNNGKRQNEKLLFMGNGKVLLDFFKQLLTGQFITIAMQKDFEAWISENFSFSFRGQPNQISLKYASKVISGNERAAKGNRLIDVKSNNGKFEIIQLAIKNREQN